MLISKNMIFKGFSLAQIMKSFSAVCIIVITFNLCLVWSESFEDEKAGFYNGQFTFNKGNQGTNLTCPDNPVCTLTSIRCKSNADCYPAMPVCCTAQGIRCCNPAGSGTGQQICPGNNPPPACLRPDVCTSDAECSAGERCCRTYFGGRLLNYSCCITATRGPQCPATVDQTTCVAAAEQCGANSECPSDQVCCSIGGSATIRCCVFPMCPAIITTVNQCNNANADPCDAGGDACPVPEICCYPGITTTRCCVTEPTVG